MNETSRPSRQELVDRALGVAQRVHVYEQESNELRSLHPNSIRELSKSELFKVAQPQRIGGYEESIGTVHAVTSALSTGCVSTAWVYMVMTAHT